MNIQRLRNLTTDILRMDFINSLPQPFMANFIGKDRWPVYDIAVDGACLRIDVFGMLQHKAFCEVVSLEDADGNIHDAEIFYCDYDHT